MGAADEIGAVIDGFYAAAVSETTWETALERLLEAMRFDGVALYLYDRSVAVFDESSRQLVRGLWHRLSIDSQVDYEQHYFKIDPRIQHIARNPGTRILYDYLHTPEEEMDRNEYYHWYQSTQATRYYIGGQTASDLPYWGGITLHRRRQFGAAQQDEIERFGFLFNHLERALAVDYRLNLKGGDARALEGLIEANPTGIVFLNDGGDVVMSNEAARAMAARRDAFAIESNAIRMLRNGNGQSLERLIADAASLRPSHDCRGVLRLPRRSGKRDYLVIVTRLPRRQGIFAPWGAAICLIIFDPDERPEPAHDLLQRMYGLTVAEARLATQLLASGKLEIAASELGIAMTTARFHLASIFRKTGTERQTDLVRLLVSIPWPALRFGSTASDMSPFK
ncbi:MAG TPA: hypothetical protein VKZ79_22375 [Alphaproteobacteria bacterium]|nr:hypothetical protein [Alphaproteobacteria bacterium]